MLYMKENNIIQIAKITMVNQNITLQYALNDAGIIQK